MTVKSFIFDQIHLEVARNASDDFNLFHDKHKWFQITHNPFKGPIALGFQINTLIEYQMRLYRELNHENEIIEENDLRFSNYQFIFINALRPGKKFYLDIKKTLIKTIPELALTNRVSLKTDNKTILLGYKKETKSPIFLADTDLSGLPDLDNLEDKTIVPDTDYFLKRKYINNSNVKNFLSGSLAEQSVYFDELAQTAEYPEVFPCSLTSGALLEKAQMENHDFKRNPLVYTSHYISVDRHCLKLIQDHERLHILVKQHPESSNNTLNHTDIMLRTYDCYGLLNNNDILFRIRLNLAPLEEILKNVSP